MYSNILMMSSELNCISISSIHSVDYLCINNEISKTEARNLSRNADLSVKRGKHKNLLSHNKDG